jgi:hypothetical protein
MPTVPPDPYPPNEEPLLVEKWFYNYNVTPGARFGPGYIGILDEKNGSFAVGFKENYWANVEEPDDSLWKEFTNDGWGPWKGVLDHANPLKNRCGNVGVQSPINLKESGAKCHETHQVRTKVSSRK